MSKIIKKEINHKMRLICNVFIFLSAVSDNQQYLTHHRKRIMNIINPFFHRIHENSSILHELPASEDFHLKIQTFRYFKFSSNNLGFLEFLLLTTFRPVRSSNSLKALPAMFPPSLATILLSSKP